ncbi:hypothetical protein ABMA28_009640 [Loxostege sticticalis]|uniref:Reverse transcriptase domain-containing protein n=1 Tax=Loxostege sticticalis TaxID=481309 RepID=A0ABD0SAY7_LOXSC
MPCNLDEVNKIIDSLDSNSSIGLDGISTKSIKCLKDIILRDLVTCFNKLLSEGHFPDTLKMAKVSPIYKSGSKSDVGNYRPISVLPHLHSINFISDRQYGFRQKSNTLTATIDLVTKIKLNIDAKKLVLGVFIDLKKAFDTSYLTNRCQVVKIGNTQSGPLPITCGVPQGSILGPLLFLIYVNNIDDIGLKGQLSLYADDTCLFYFGTNLNWHTQIDYIKSRLSSLAGILRNIVHCLPKRVRLTIYNSSVKSHLLYLIEIWGNASKTKLKELQVLQNRIIKSLFHYPYLTRTDIQQTAGRHKKGGEFCLYRASQVTISAICWRTVKSRRQLDYLFCAVSNTTNTTYQGQAKQKPSKALNENWCPSVWPKYFSSNFTSQKTYRQCFISQMNLWQIYISHFIYLVKFSFGKILLCQVFISQIFTMQTTYYSAQVCAQTQVHSLFLHSHSPMGQQSDTTGERSGAGPTA